jgi:hypothetical protein
MAASTWQLTALGALILPLADSPVKFIPAAEFVATTTDALSRGTHPTIGIDEPQSSPACPCVTRITLHDRCAPDPAQMQSTVLLSQAPGAARYSSGVDIRPRPYPMHTCGFIDAGVPGGHAMNPVVKYFQAIISSS